MDIAKDGVHKLGVCPRCGITCEVRYLQRVGAYLYVEMDEDGKLVKCHFLDPDLPPNLESALESV